MTESLRITGSDESPDWTTAPSDTQLLGARLGRGRLLARRIVLVRPMVVAMHLVFALVTRPQFRYKLSGVFFRVFLETNLMLGYGRFEAVELKSASKVTLLPFSRFLLQYNTIEKL
jgi:hypothetical protein